MKRLKKQLFLFSSVLTVLLLTTVACDAGILSVDVDIVGVNTETQEEMKHQIQVPLDSKEFSSEDNRFGNSQTMWELEDLDVSGNIDPEVTLAYALSNNTNVPLAFIMSVTVPISPAFVNGTRHGGSTGGAVLDTGQPVSISTVAGKPLYSGEIDGSTVLSLYPDPNSFVGVGAATIPAISSGIPGFTNPSGPALASIGITNEFILGPGDTVVLGSNFAVVPEPGGIILVLLACSAFVCLRR